MGDLEKYWVGLTLPQVTFIIVVFLLPVILWRLIASKSGSVFVAKWDDRIQNATDQMRAASTDVDELTIATAKSRITELEIASRQKLLGESDRMLLLSEIEGLKNIVREIEERMATGS